MIIVRENGVLELIRISNDNGTAEFLDAPAGIERAKSALEEADTIQDFSTAAGEMDYGLRIKTTNSYAPKAAVIIHINQLPD